jgi:hypothetical protein
VIFCFCFQKDTKRERERGWKSIRKHINNNQKRHSKTEDALEGELWDQRHGRVEPWGFPVVSGTKPVA